MLDAIQFIMIYHINMKHLINSILTIAVLIIITSCSTFNILTHIPFSQSIERSFKWNDGPWLTMQGIPGTEITISWVTKEKTKTIISYGTNKQSLIEITSEDLETRLHHSIIKGLQPNQTYYYKIGLLSEEDSLFTFKTPPAENQQFKFCIIGDLQPKEEQTRTGGKIIAQAMQREDPNFVIQLGDVSSFGGSKKYWHYTLQNISIYAASVPFQSIVGNHDYYGDTGGNYRDVFPYNYPSEEGLYYSFDYQNAHFIMIDNFDDDGSVSETQKQWVEKDIKDAQSRDQKWIFLFFHHAAFTTGTSKQDWDLQKWLVPIADKYRVDGVFFGHDHHYEHWNYQYGNSGLLYSENDKPSNNPVNYWCTGGGGADLEISYGILSMENKVYTRNWFNSNTGEWEIHEYQKQPWNMSKYIDHTDNPEYGQLIDGKHYYHLPNEESYQSDNGLYGYRYGEETLHYMLVEINDDFCIISARYPNGDLIEGPGNKYPQEWEFHK